MADCVAIAHRVGERIGSELGIPVYLYEEAALIPERHNLAFCRQGEYEALNTKLGTDQWKPDFGPNEFNSHVARTGATNVGARQFLVAYNVNLNTRSRQIASDIAMDIREAGRAQRDEEGKIVRDEAGQAIKVPGTLKAAKAVGWIIPEYDRAQISINLVNTDITKPHEAFEEVRRQARQRGVRVTGSELVGLIPERDLLAAGKYYLRAAGQSAGVPRKMIIETAIQSLGLREIAPFKTSEKIVEYQAGLTDGPLVCMSNREFVDELSTDSPAPGGGSVAALIAAQAAALTAMVANLTVGKKGYESAQERIKEIAEEAQEAKDIFLSAMDEDTAAFNAVMDCFRLPRKTPEQKKSRELATAAATRAATQVPLSVLARIPGLLALVAEIVEIGNQNSLSDAGVAALSAMSAGEGAYFNVLINLASLHDLDQTEDPEFVAAVHTSAVRAMQSSEKSFLAIRQMVRDQLESALA